MNIVGVTGVAGSGKDTVADHLVHRHGFRKYALATPLKHMCMEVYGLTQRQVFGTQADKAIIDFRHGKSPRQLMQFLGTDVLRRYLGDDVWCRATERAILVHPSSPPSRVVISDIRFQNEADYFQGMADSHGGTFTLIFVDRPGLDPGSHVSETECLTLTARRKYVVRNAGSVSELYAAIDNVCGDECGRKT